MTIAPGAGGPSKLPLADEAATLTEGRAVLGIELGSTRIKACLIGLDHTPLATGSHKWENQFSDRVWTYSLDAVWSGVQDAVASVREDAERRHGVRPQSFAAVGVSAMMHGYLAFDAEGQLLVPFRTWRNTNTDAAATRLTELLNHNIPMRWSIAHLYQAVLDEEPHVTDVSFVTTLAGYVHWRLTGQKVVGAGDASGIFPLRAHSCAYDDQKLKIVDSLLANLGFATPLLDLLPRPLAAGRPAGTITAEGALLLDPTGSLAAGSPMCPPEGDAGTGMVATNSVSPRAGNVSAGTSIFAMVVLEDALRHVHHELDVVTTPAGDPVAMVHCNNGASELGAWAEVFGQFATALGHTTDANEVFETLLTAALDGEADGGGLLSYNYLSGEPIAEVAEGRPLFVRTPGSKLTLANFMRSQLYGAFGTLSLGMRTLAAEGVRIDSMFAHGGLFKTAGVAQRLLAASLGVPIAVGRTAGEGGSWGMALLASYLLEGDGDTLADYLGARVFAQADLQVCAPLDDDVAGYAAFLERFRHGLTIERAAVAALH